MSHDGHQCIFSGAPLSDDQINRLYATHFEDLELLESTWESELSLLRDTQKNEFREWLNTVAEDIHSNDASKLPYSASSSKLSQMCSSLEPDLEESFTIYLGTQLKTMHNIRLLVMDPIDLCRFVLHLSSSLVIFTTISSQYLIEKRQAIQKQHAFNVFP